jgi:hypothetical protein
VGLAVLTAKAAFATIMTTGDMRGHCRTILQQGLLVVSGNPVGGNLGTLTGH